MAREKRKWYPGATYHIVVRGVRRHTLFLNEDDYHLFLNIVKKVKEKHDFILNSYCLMKNHIHLQITTKEIAIWTIMQAILSYYARQFNMRYGYKGHLFEDRYFSSLIEDTRYFLEVSRYIHLNPYKAGVVSSPEEYEFSSFRNYLGEESAIVDDSMILSYFHNYFIPRDGYKYYVKSKMYDS